MKDIVNRNIGSQVFAIDRDACTVLEGYLREIRVRLPADDRETLADIEVRLAEIFREHCASQVRVVTIEMVRAAMAQMGDPADFGEVRGGAESQKSAEPRKLCRSQDGAIGGVCAGIAEYFDVDPTVVRLLTLGLVIFGGLSVWIYILLWIIIPKRELKVK